ncbi:tryptophan--tRNA ligase [Patescibacteria group bacterium]|nr:tryptophan--tRNA ligase [Patescibacteria group bacterium]MBU1246839.1 tryptophan--tRNA ligase [Patescibacteria group bacterium]MBU1519190.1 tryptophan--tRNA ligase [Patescibacteria group bacterium]MBU1730514.1 tryptophan--tRNA ligase [Patescibacteria group bacterium]MBU1956478.1 tryptophan--tRNA ligase [Patescibacteria group bacterium]
MEKEKNKKKILLSGIKPSGVLHIGNYFGAVQQWVKMQEDYESYVFIANYHAITSVQDAERLRYQTLEVALDYLAVGLNPDKVNFFVQSDVLEVAELTWIFNCITTMPYLMRAHAYKDAVAKNEEVNVGLFDYPILMAADILIQDTNVVPVGADQKQHVEYARDTAEKFNHIFKKEIFTLPQPIILSETGVIKGVDGRKMSKSYNNIIPLFGSDEIIKKAVMSISTDSKVVDEPKDPKKCNVFALHKLFAGENLPKIIEKYKKGGMGYKESKEILIENMISFIKPMRDKREDLAKNPDYVLEVLRKGGTVARERAIKKMKIIQECVGIIKTLN